MIKRTIDITDAGTYEVTFVGSRKATVKHGDVLFFEFQTEDGRRHSQMVGATLNSSAKAPSKCTQLLAKLTNSTPDDIAGYDETRGMVEFSDGVTTHLPGCRYEISLVQNGDYLVITDVNVLGAPVGASA